jgi:hypothetical protein
MDYLSFTNGLFKELKSFKGYSNLNLVCKILMAIATLPFTLAALVCVIAYYILGFFKNAIAMPAEDLEAWVDKRKSGEHFLPTAVIYLVALPFIFLLRVVYSLMSIVFYFMWFEIMMFTFVATLGGVRWQPFVNKAKYDEEYAWDYKLDGTVLNIASAIIAIVSIILVIVLYENAFTIALLIEAIAIALVFMKSYVCKASDFYNMVSAAAKKSSEDSFPLNENKTSSTQTPASETDDNSGNTNNTPFSF